MRYTDADWRIGFSLLSEGKHVFTIGEGKFGTAEDGSSTSRLSFTLTCSEGEETGSNAFVSFDLSKPSGRKAFAMMLEGAGIVDKLEKKFNLNPDLSVQEWANKYLDISSSKCMQVINMAIVQLANKTIAGLVRHRTYKDKNGADKTVADVYEFAPLKSAKPTQEEVFTKETEKEDEEDSW